MPAARYRVAARRLRNTAIRDVQKCDSNDMDIPRITHMLPLTSGPRQILRASQFSMHTVASVCKCKAVRRMKPRPQHTGTWSTAVCTVATTSTRVIAQQYATTSTRVIAQQYSPATFPSLRFRSSKGKIRNRFNVLKLCTVCNCIQSGSACTIAFNRLVPVQWFTNFKLKKRPFWYEFATPCLPWHKDRNSRIIQLITSCISA